MQVLNAAPAAYTVQSTRSLPGSGGQPLSTPSYQPVAPVRNAFTTGSYNPVKVAIGSVPPAAPNPSSYVVQTQSMGLSQLTPVGSVPPAVPNPSNFVVQTKSMGFPQLTPRISQLSPPAVTKDLPAPAATKDWTMQAAFQATAPVKPQEVTRVSIGTAVQRSTSVLHRLLRAQLQPGALNEILGLMNGESLKEALLESEGLSNFDIFLQSDGTLVTYCRFDSETGLQASGARVEHALQLMEKHLVGETHRLSAKGGLVTPAGLKVWSLRGKPHVVQHRMAQIAIKPGCVESLKLRACRPEIEQACKKILGLQAVEIVAVSDEVIITKCSYESTELMQASEAKAQEVLAFLSEYATRSPTCFSARGGIVDIAGEKVWSFSTPSYVMLSRPSTMDVERPMVLAKSSEPTVEKPLVPPVPHKKRSGGDCFSWFTQGSAKRRIREQDTTSADVVMGA